MFLICMLLILLLVDDQVMGLRISNKWIEYINT